MDGCFSICVVPLLTTGGTVCVCDVKQKNKDMSTEAKSTEPGTLTKVIEWKGRGEALAGAIGSTALGALLIAAGVLKWRRERELKDNPNAASTKNTADDFPASWLMFAVAAVVVVVSWVWLFLTIKYKAAAIAEGIE
jgi:hypothetical protein